VRGPVTAVVLALVAGGIAVAGLVSAAGTGAQPGPRRAQQAAGLQPVGRVAEASGRPGRAAASGRAGQPGPAGTSGHSGAARVSGGAGTAGVSRRAGAAGGSHQAAAKLAANSAAAGYRLRTSCRSVAHIGDSTSVGMVSAGYLPDPAQRLAAQYADVGVRHAWINAPGGRSMVEALPGQVNGYDTARQLASAGFRGCWVIALGTNDTANVSAGSTVGRLARIRELMSAAHGAPVLWVNVKTLDQSGPWAEANMLRWNAALTQACHQYPNLRVFDWSAVARDHWFISDGIHYTPAGYAARARLTARALARAFPAGGPSTGCLIG
jgi:lysophospholipase L1-like esterase